MEVEEIINVEVPVKPQNNGGSDLQKYYGYLKSKGADVPPTFDSFQKTLQDEQSARKYYDYVKKSGYDAPPTYESFANTLGLKKKETTTPQVSTKDLGTTVSPLKNGGQSVPDGNSPKQPNFSPVGQLLGGGADESKLKGFGLPVMGENKPQPKADIPIPPKVKSGEQQVNVPAQDLLAQNIQDFGNRLTGEHLNKNIAEGTVKVKANPQDDKGLYQLAYGYLESGNDATAKKIFEDVLLANPENADAIEGLAHIASKNNDAKTALELNEQAFAKAPTIQRINNIAQLKLQSGDVEGAKQASDYAIENAPDDYRALQIKSLVEKKLGNNTESSEYLTKAIEKYQENIKAPLLSQQEQDYKGKIDTRTEAEQWQSSIDNLGNIAGEFIGNAMNLPQYAGQNVEGIVNGLTEMKHGMERMNPFNEASSARDRFIGFLQTLQGASEASFGGLMMTPHGYVFTQGINAADVITNGEAGKILMAPLQSYLPVQNEIGQRLEGLGDVLISLIAFGAMHKGLSSKGVDVQKVTDAYGKYKRGESLTGEDIKVLSGLVDENTNPETLKKLRKVSETFPKENKPAPEIVAYLASLDSEVFGSMDALTPYQKVIVAPLLEQRNAEIKKKEAAAPPLKKIHDEKIKAIDEKINEAITKDQVEAAKKEVDDHIKQLALQQRDQLGLPLAEPAIEKGESLIHTDLPKELTKEEKLKQSQQESGGVISDVPTGKVDVSISSSPLLKESKLSSQLKTENDAIEKGKIEVNDQSEHKGTDVNRTTTETSNSDSNAPSGKVETKPQEEEITNPLSGVESFETSQGSIYTVLPDGRTERFKTATGEKNEPQDLIVFPKFKDIAQEQRFLEGVQRSKESGTKVYVLNSDGKVARTNSDLKQGARLVLVDKDGKFIESAETSLSPKIGHATYDSRTWESGGETYTQRHIGNDIVKINKSKKEQDNQPKDVAEKSKQEEVKAQKGKVYRATDNLSEVTGDDRSFSKTTDWYEGNGFLVETSEKNTVGENVPHNKNTLRGGFYNPEKIYYEPEAFTDPKYAKKEIEKFKEKYPNVEFVRIKTEEDASGKFIRKIVPHADFENVINPPKVTPKVEIPITRGEAEKSKQEEVSDNGNTFKSAWESNVEALVHPETGLSAVVSKALDEQQPLKDAFLKRIGHDIESYRALDEKAKEKIQQEWIKSDEFKKLDKLYENKKSKSTSKEELSPEIAALEEQRDKAIRDAQIASTSEEQFVQESKKIHKEFDHKIKALEGKVVEPFKDVSDNRSVYEFQDANGEAIHEKPFVGSQEVRLKIENAGDILRELSKHSDGFASSSYIREKLEKIGKFLNESFHPEDSYDLFSKNNPERIDEFKDAYERQPTFTDQQLKTKELILSIVDGDLPKAKKLFNEINKDIDGFIEKNKKAVESKSKTETDEKTSTDSTTEAKGEGVKHESKESSSKTTIKEGEVVGGNVELSKEEKAAGFVKLPIAKVKKALKDFQGRTAEYSKTTYDSIVGEAKEGTLNISSIPAIQIWGETGELLAGHSRVKAFEDLASGKLPLNEKYKPSDFENINAQIVEAKTREEAKRIAERSNSGAQQTPFENSKILARMRREGATKGAIDKEASRLAQHGDKKHTINLSNLSEDGKASLTLAAAEKTPEKIGKERTEAIRLAADKAGEMRGEFPELTKLHEDEIFDALINGKVKAGEVEARVNRVVNSAAEPFNPSNKLNIESIAHISPEEMIFQQRTADLRKEIKDLQRSIKRDAETKLTPIEQDYLERAIALNNGSESLGRKEFESEKTKNLITKKTDEAKALLKRRQEDLQNHLISKKNLSGAPSLFDVVNTEIKNKTITNEQANRFIEATEDVAKDEAVITNLESKEKGATEVSELKEVVKAADELIEKSKEEPPKTYTEKAKRVADKIRSFKSKPLDLRDENGNKIVIEKKGFDDNDLIEGIAKLVEQGGRLADAIKSELEKHKWYNDLTDKGKDAVYKQLEESFSKEGSGITHELTDETRKEFGLGEPYEGRETVHDIDLNNRAEAAIKEGYNIDRLVSRLRDGSFPDELETVILKKYKATLEAQIEKNPTPEKLQELKDFVKATDIVGTLQGAAFRQRQGIEIRDDSLAGYFAREMDNNGGAELTEAQKIKVQEEYKKIKEAQAAYDEKIAKLEEENAKLKAQSELNKVKNTTAKKPKKAHDDFVAERKDILNSISDKLKASRGQANDIIRATIDFTKIAPDVAKLMKSYVEEGYSKLEDIVKKIHDDLKPHIDDITEKDVYDIIAGEYKEKKATKSELAAKLVDLKEQARLSNKLDALLRGEEPKNEKAKIKRNKEIEDLRNNIKEFRKEKAEAESVQKKLDEQKQKQASKLTPEKQALQNLKKKYANQILQLENDLRTNNFLKPEKKVPLKMDKEAIALQDELIKLKRERETRLARQAYQNRTRQQKFMDTFKEVLNIPRTIISSMDFSAPLRQGVIPSISHPTVAMRAAKEMFKMAVSEKRFDRWFDDVKKTPRWRLMEESGLYVADPHDPRLSVKEEAFMNNLAEKIPIAGKLIKGSERAYVGYLNKMRVDLFNRFADVLEVQGKTWENSPELYKALGDYINNSTGRGKINAIEQAAPLLNGLLFSPRLIASRLNLLNPLYYKSLPKEVRIEAMKDMGKFLGVGMAVLALAALNGADVETDPRSSDFGKIQVGKTRYDIWGGFQQYIRVLAQFVSGQAKSTASDQIREINGEGKFGESRASVVGRFVRGKASPILSSVINLAAGTDMMGNKSTLQSELLRFVTPLIFSDLSDAMKDKGISSLFTVGVPATFGVGVSTYLPKGYDTKDLEDKTLKFLYDKNLNLSIPTQQELTDKEYQEFQPIQKKYLKEEWQNIIEHGALFNEEGNPTIDEDAAITIKPVDRLTYDDLTKLMKSASNRATRKAKKEVVNHDTSDTNETITEIEEIGN